MKILKDCYGSRIKPGCQVAFNYSGEVRVGFLKKIVERHSRRDARYWDTEPHYNFLIEHFDDKNEISTITRKENLVVLNYN